ncbi:MAG: helix-turn-helix transcriptional regulator [Pseudomonadota bacterium]
MDLARRLKDRRKKMGLSQAELAHKIDVSQPTIANWERGGHTPRQDALQRIAAALDTDPSWLLSGELPAWKNPAHMHLAKPIHHIPVYEWPIGTTNPIGSQPYRYIAIAADVTDVFALSANETTGFPNGTVLIFSKTKADMPGQFLCRTADGFSLEKCTSFRDNVFARLVYSVVPH